MLIRRSHITGKLRFLISQNSASRLFRARYFYAESFELGVTKRTQLGYPMWQRRVGYTLSLMKETKVLRRFFFPVVACVLLPVGAANADIITGDMDLDGDVDVPDAVAFEICMQGPSVPVTGSCRVGDTNLDTDVDLHDFAELQRNFTGPL